ncbi:Laminin subunit alpha-1 [Tupaia chinensis]|uniref:Laminin A chain n=1 Tax=Tupaia chinensis TaxID=246437 RepID=L8Y912_TUPCH|nr:Laminin subunit alpha-1 [Tupaia chinensis]
MQHFCGLFETGGENRRPAGGTVAEMGFTELGWDFPRELEGAQRRGKWPGQCPCKEGYAGERCDRCQLGHKGYPNCVRCDCSLAGSVNNDPCTEPCLCKKNVEGKNCDRCKPGSYNLKESNPQGCSECFCFGVSDVCDSLSWPVGQVNDMSGWMVTDLISPSKIQSQQDVLGGHRQVSINNTVVQHRLASTYYWSAPEAYLRNKLTAFGGFLKYTVSYDIPVETVGNDLVSHADVIIKGNGLTLSTQVEGLSLRPYEKYINVVRLVPENFRDFNNRKEIDRDQLMTVLANVSHLLIRANYNSAKMALYRLDSVSLDTASPNAVDLAVAPDVEHCECPQGYTGTSCESCLSGYYRVDGILFGGICQPCECHGHATECDIHGVCFGCAHNTTGDHCEQCLPGFYGVPSRGTPGDCQPCACPLAVASNKCADGYYGNPAVPGESCVPCDCSGNVDPSEPGHCDSVTGECLKCIGNTDGAHCERCADGFYGDAVTAKNCRACQCHEQGSLSAVCHHETGLCDCRPHVTGQQCDQCLHGYYGLDRGLGCLPCNCNTAGSMSDDCTDEGQCRCVPGVAGKRCDRCSHGFYGYKDGGCTPCDCPHTQNTCDPESGECTCPPHTQGPKCEECEEEHWGHHLELGCQACNCSRVGSVSPQCHVLTGDCHCKSEFGGRRCDQCSLGHRDFPDCVPCDCDLRGTLADTCDLDRGLCECAEETGTCSCKENVFGLQCSECRAGTFALQADNPLGCSPCFCFGLSGICSELEGYVRIPVTLDSDQPLLRVVSQSNLRGTAEGVYYQAPDVLLDAVTVRQHVKAEPFYWRLPKIFQGDQLMAYGGKLKYTIAFYSSDGVGTYNFEPQVLIKGGRIRKQVIYMDAPAPENGVRQEQEVAMKENCNDNTAGDHCDVCAPGYYGKVTGSANDCSLCTCPHSYPNSFSPTCVLEGDHDFRCDACLLGYEGQYCERCSSGYHGNPQTLGGSCQKCDCSPHGSVHNNCDRVSGQCVCRPGATGLRCEECEPRHILVESDCVSCNDECVGVLLNDLDYVGDALVSMNVTGVIPIPYGILSNLENTTDYLRLTRMVTRSQQVKRETERILSESQDLATSIEWLQMNIREMLEKATTLNQTLDKDFQFPNSTLQNIWQNITALLENIQKRHFMQLHQNAALELKAAEDLLSQIQKNYQKPQERLEKLKEATDVLLSKHSRELRAAEDLVREAETKIQEINRLLPIVNSSLREFNDKKLHVQEEQNLTLKLIANGRRLIDAAIALENAAPNALTQLEHQWDELLLWTAKIRHHVDDLVMQMSKRNAVDLVYRAEDHAAELQRLARVLDSGLESGKHVSLNATSAAHVHSNIQNLIEESETLAKDAHQMVTKVSLFSGALVSNGKAALQQSYKSLKEANNLSRKRQGITLKLSDVKRAANRFQENADKIIRQTNDSLLILRAIPEGVSDIGLQTKELATSANQNAVSTLKAVMGLSQKLLNTSTGLSRVNATLLETNKLLQDSTMTTLLAGRKVKDMETQANVLFDRLKPLKILEENLNRNLSEIKLLISQARKQAASIKVAVSADRDCIRAYQPPISSTNYNNLILNVKTPEPDNLLFYLGSSSSSDFLAVEMRRGQVAFLWDMGSGSARLEFPDFPINDDKWHTIHITSPQEEDASFHFDGSGYSIIEKTLRTTVTQIIILFNSFSPNGLLLYLASNGTKDFLSIELVHGRVKVTVDLGSGPLALITDRRYNNGTWYKIVFQRNRKQGLLAVIDTYNTSNKETKQGETPGASSDLNRLEKDPIYVGGLPWSRVVRKGVTSRNFVGCIKNLEISRSTFDLLRNSYGVRKGCVLEPIRSVSFLRGGYVELPPKSLSPESELLATFVTKSSSGIILAALNKEVEKQGYPQAPGPFFSIMLIGGHVEVHVSPGDGTSLRKALLHAPTGTFSDGQEHSISMARNQRIITVQVDETNPVEMKLGPLAERTINISNLYIGGIPEGVETSVLKMRRSFHGCIRNLILNMELLDFTSAIGYESADLDTCLLSERPSLHREDSELVPVPQPVPEPEQCAVDTVPEYVSGAHQFGLTQSSHLMLSFDQLAVRKRLSVQLSIRTFAASGLVFYMAHQNQLDYAVLQLHGGRLHFMFDLGKGRTKVSHPTLLSDGKWHTVKTEYFKRKGFMTIDGQESPMVTMVGDGITLDVEGKLYLGGLPSNYRARNIGNITHSIPACIGEVRVNSKQLDKDSPVSAFAVNRCYAAAQEGTFFEGSGYAAFVKEGYKVRSDLNITLEFRTTSENGVLLGISSAKVDAIGLEMVKGKLLFHVNNGAGRITATYEPKATLCDGKWHMLHANKSKHRVVLTVDGNEVHAESPHTQSTSADTNNPIYVGGYPANVKQNCLSSQTPFRGCLRKLTLIKSPQVQSFDFSRAFELQGVVPHSCPGMET